ncbi:diguanylate cyclase regulator RdcB family protein [Okeanomitos corallinicola TIOX110]|uniref:Diguanylate cyclase regulator RdcB family protein n=1 Tax=Okeanomitos corallinicola TIOX110 TaxID=3133117 RepID=A0ABZ2UYJ7_9CYAN
MTNLFSPQESGNFQQNTGFVTPSTQTLEKLQRRVPVVGDKAIIDLINGIQINKEMLRYRKNRGWFGNLISKLDGSDNKRQILLDGNLIAGQEALANWVLELTDSLKISQTALEITQNSLLEARDAIRHQKQRLQKQEDAINKLSEQFNQLAEQVHQRLNNIESRIRKLEVRVAANEDLDHIITAWAAGQTYSQLPWAIQIALLAREVFSSSVINYELETGDKERYRQLLVNKIIAHSKQLPNSFFGIGDLLEQTWISMNNDDRELTAGLLEIRSIPQKRLTNIPHLFVIGTTLELATLPEEVRPNKPAQSAIYLCRAQIDSISRTTDAREFITTIVEETANDCLTIINNISN